VRDRRITARQEVSNDQIAHAMRGKTWAHRGKGNDHVLRAGEKVRRVARSRRGERRKLSRTMGDLWLSKKLRWQGPAKI